MAVDKGWVSTSDTKKDSEVQPATSTYTATENNCLFMGRGQQGHTAKLRPEKINIRRKFTSSVLASHSHKTIPFW